MAVTPVDILNQKFDRKVRGYDTSEVDSFMKTVADEIGKLLEDNVRLREQIYGLEAELRRYRDIEGTLNNALILAQKTADELKAVAQQNAELIVREAQEKMERETEQARAQLEDIKRAKERFSVEFKVLLRGYLDMFEGEVNGR